jgi:hypothetical protein
MSSSLLEALNKFRSTVRASVSSDSGSAPGPELDLLLMTPKQNEVAAELQLGGLERPDGTRSRSSQVSEQSLEDSEEVELVNDSQSTSTTRSSSTSFSTKGIPRGTEAWSLAMKLRRAFHSQDKKIDKLTSQLSNVAQTWKGEVTSQRNTCYLPGMGALETNGQEWLAQTPLQVGFGGVGATGAHHSKNGLRS